MIDFGNTHQPIPLEKVTIVKNEQVEFDYSSLEESVREQLLEHRRSIGLLSVGTTGAAIKIGGFLIAVRNLLSRPQFTAWLWAEFQWTRSNPDRLMRIADRFGDIDGIEHVGTSILCYLARERVSDAARREAVRMVKRGERVTLSNA